MSPADIVALRYARKLCRDRVRECQRSIAKLSERDRSISSGHEDVEDLAKALHAAETLERIIDGAKP